MKNSPNRERWNAAEWSLFILTLCVPTLFMFIFVSRWIGVPPMEQSQLSAVTDIFNMLLGGIFAILGGVLTEIAHRRRIREEKKEEEKKKKEETID